MDLGDMMDKATEAAKNVSDDQIDQAESFIEGRIDDKYDGIVEKLGDQAKKFNN